jgi:hypothetical protein
MHSKRPILALFGIVAAVITLMTFSALGADWRSHHGFQHPTRSAGWSWDESAVD